MRWLVCNNIASGYSDSTFRPGNYVNRAQLSKMVTLVSGWELLHPEVPRFSDVAPGTPFYEYIETAVTHAVISGFPDDTFRPESLVSRGQLSRVIVLVRGWTLTNPSTPTFRDVPRNSPLYTYIETAASQSIVTGYTDGAFRPDNNASRAQVAKLIQRAYSP